MAWRGTLLYRGPVCGVAFILPATKLEQGRKADEWLKEMSPPKQAYLGMCLKFTLLPRVVVDERNGGFFQTELRPNNPLMAFFAAQQARLDQKTTVF
jgi:hypothetical protein